jgi:hypothetical protein
MFVDLGHELADSLEIIDPALARCCHLLYGGKFDSVSLLSNFIEWDCTGPCGGQGKTDTELSHESEGFIVIGTDVTEIRMLPSAVVEHFNVVNPYVSTEAAVLKLR